MCLPKLPKTKYILLGRFSLCRLLVLLSILKRILVVILAETLLSDWFQCLWRVYFLLAIWVRFGRLIRGWGRALVGSIFINLWCWFHRFYLLVLLIIYIVPSSWFKLLRETRLNSYMGSVLFVPELNNMTYLLLWPMEDYWSTIEVLQPANS